MIDHVTQSLASLPHLNYVTIHEDTGTRPGIAIPYYYFHDLEKLCVLAYAQLSPDTVAGLALCVANCPALQSLQFHDLPSTVTPEELFSLCRMSTPLPLERLCLWYPPHANDVSLRCHISSLSALSASGNCSILRLLHEEGVKLVRLHSPWSTSALFYITSYSGLRSLYVDVADFDGLDPGLFFTDALSKHAAFLAELSLPVWPRNWSITPASVAAIMRCVGLEKVAFRVDVQNGNSRDLMVSFLLYAAKHAFWHFLTIPLS